MKKRTTVYWVQVTNHLNSAATFRLMETEVDETAKQYAVPPEHRRGGANRALPGYAFIVPKHEAARRGVYHTAAEAIAAAQARLAASIEATAVKLAELRLDAAALEAFAERQGAADG